MAESGTQIVKRYETGSAAPPGPPPMTGLAFRQIADQIIRNLPPQHTTLKTGRLTEDAAQNASVQVNTGSPYAKMRLATGQRHTAGNAVVVTFAGNDPQQPVGIAAGGWMAP